MSEEIYDVFNSFSKVKSRFLLSLIKVNKTAWKTKDQKCSLSVSMVGLAVAGRAACTTLAWVTNSGRQGSRDQRTYVICGSNRAADFPVSLFVPRSWVFRQPSSPPLVFITTAPLSPSPFQVWTGRNQIKVLSFPASSHSPTQHQPSNSTWCEKLESQQIVWTEIGNFWMNFTQQLPTRADFKERC